MTRPAESDALKRHAYCFESSIHSLLSSTYVISLDREVRQMLTSRSAVDRYQCRASCNLRIRRRTRCSLTAEVVNNIYLCAYTRILARVATQPRRLIVSVVACNPRGHRKHVINTCSLSARARKSCRCNTQLSRAGRR